MLNLSSCVYVCVSCETDAKNFREAVKCENRQRRRAAMGGNPRVKRIANADHARLPRSGTHEFKHSRARTEMTMSVAEQSSITHGDAK
jgi:hypothetical protein